MSLLDRLRPCVASVLNIDADRVVIEARWGDDLGADDLDRLDIGLRVEEIFGIDLPDDHMDFATVGELIAFIEKRVQ